MNIDTQIQEDHQIKLNVEVEADMLEGAKRRVARRLANRIKVPGFRPGKAPYPVILKQVGEGAILEEALNLIVDELYPKALEEANIQAYAPGKLENIPNLDNISSGEPFTITFLVPLKPEVVLGNYQSITKVYEKPLVDDKDVDNFMDELRTRQAIIEPVERPAQSGDLVLIQISGERKEVDEGQQLILIRDQEKQMPILEGDDPDEWPYPGFSKELIGLSTGDEKVTEYTFPDDTKQTTLAGVQAIFRLILKDVKSRTLPELDDEFAASLGEFENLEALRAEVRTTLEDQSVKDYEGMYEDEVLELATSQSIIKYPPQMLEHEIDDVIDNLKNRLERQKMDIDLYLKSRNISMEELRKEAQPAAETRLKRSLVLIEIARAEKIQLDPSEVQTETLSAMDTLSGMLPQKEVKKLSNRNVMQNLMSNVMSDMLIRKAAERMRLIASGQLEDQVIETPEDANTEQEALESSAIVKDTALDAAMDEAESSAQ